MSTLELDIRPGQGVGPFELGASLWNVLDTLREGKARFPQVEVKFDNAAPSTSPIILTLPPHVSLLFTGVTQRLHTILLHPLTPVPPHAGLCLTYKSSLLSSPSQPLKRANVSAVFGPTYRGKRRLIFPGVVFEFQGAKGGREEGVERVVVLQREADRSGLAEVVEEDGLRVCEAMVGELQKAVLTVHDGVTLHFHPPLASSSSAPLDPPEPITVTLHQTTAEDLLADLGPPLRTHYKQDERMSIHSSAAAGGREEEENSYFYNYFQHGIDFLLDGETHRVVKIVVHSNVVGSALFQRYKRCPWILRPPSTGPPEVEVSDSLPSTAPAPVPAGVSVSDTADALTRLLAPSSSTSASTTETITSGNGGGGGRTDAPPSMILDRASESRDGPLMIGTTTRLVGFDGVVAEVGEGGEVLGLVLF